MLIETATITTPGDPSVGIQGDFIEITGLWIDPIDFVDDAEDCGEAWAGEDVEKAGIENLRKAISKFFENRITDGRPRVEFDFELKAEAEEEARMEREQLKDELSYERITWEGRKIRDKEIIGLGYCGSVSFDFHCVQVSDSKCWVNTPGILREWYKIGLKKLGAKNEY